MQCYYRFFNKSGLRELHNVHNSRVRAASSSLVVEKCNSYRLGLVVEKCNSYRLGLVVEKCNSYRLGLVVEKCNSYRLGLVVKSVIPIV